MYLLHTCFSHYLTISIYSHQYECAHFSPSVPHSQIALFSFSQTSSYSLLGIFLSLLQITQLYSIAFTLVKFVQYSTSFTNQSHSDFFSANSHILIQFHTHFLSQSYPQLIVITITNNKLSRLTSHHATRTIIRPFSAIPHNPKFKLTINFNNTQCLAIPAPITLVYFRRWFNN
jgi:hypothetical protein